MGRHLILVLGLLMLANAGSFLSAQVSISELNYHSDSSRNTQDWIELYNFGGSSVDIGDWYIKDSNPLNRFDIPTGTTLSADGYLVIVRDIAAFSAEHPSVSNFIGSTTFGFANAGEIISLYDASDNLQLSFAYEDTVPWPKTPDGRGRTLEVIDPTADLNNPQNWFAGCIGGSPGGPFQGPCINQVVLTEINYNSALTNNPRDWVELYNTSAVPVDIGEWIFRDQNDSNEYVIPAGTLLPADGYLVLARDLDSFSSVFPAVSNVLGNFPFNLSGDGEVLRLFNSAQILQFSVAYNDDLPWPASPDGGGRTLQLIDVFGNMDTYENWFAGCPLGSPGGPFDPSCFTGLEVVGIPELEIGQNGRLLQLTIASEIPDSYRWSIFSINGQQLLGGNLQQSLQIDCSKLPAGVYLLEVASVTAPQQREHRKIVLH